jgi:hypothetical protein
VVVSLVVVVVVVMGVVVVVVICVAGGRGRQGGRGGGGGGAGGRGHHDRGGGHSGVARGKAMRYFFLADRHARKPPPLASRRPRRQTKAEIKQQAWPREERAGGIAKGSKRHTDKASH